MSETIDKESRQRSRLAINIDNMCEKYKTVTGLFTFSSPSLYTLEKNLFYLLKNSIEKQFEQKYYMKPSYLSYDEYGTVALDYILMYVNGILCIEEFNLNTIIIPTFQAIIDICVDKVPQKDIDDLTEVSW